MSTRAAASRAGRALQRGLRSLKQDARSGKAHKPKTIERSVEAKPASTPSAHKDAAAPSTPKVIVTKVSTNGGSSAGAGAAAGPQTIKVQGATPPPIPPSSGFSVGKAAGVVLFAAFGGSLGIIAYAARDHEFRRTLETHVPAVAQVLDMLAGAEKNQLHVPIIDTDQPLGNARAQHDIIGQEDTESDPLPPVADTIEEHVPDEEDLQALSSLAQGLSQIGEAPPPEESSLSKEAEEEFEVQAPPSGDNIEAELDELDMEPGLPEDMGEQDARAGDDVVADAAADPYTEEVEAVTAITDEHAARLLEQAAATEAPNIVLEADMLLPQNDDVSAIVDADERIQMLEQQLASTREQMQELQEQQRNSYQQQFNAKLQHVHEQQRIALEQDVQELRQAFEHEKRELQKSALKQKQLEIQQHLMTQEEAHKRTMADKLTEQAAEIWEISETNLRLRLGRERAQRIQELEKMFLRLKAVEAVMTRYQQREAIMTHMHSLFLAADVLTNALDSRKSLVRELKYLKSLAENDEFLEAVVNTVPTQAFTIGVASKRELVRNFASVNTAVRQVAHVPANGGLWSFASSYLVHFVSFPTSELTNGEDTESIISRAQYHVEHDNLDMAAREVNSLRGPPRVVAQGWLDETRRHLETAQAFVLIRNHLSNIALGLH